MRLTEKEQKQFDVLINKKKLTTQETVIFQRLKTKKIEKDSVNNVVSITKDVNETKNIFNDGKKNDVKLIDINLIKPNPYQPRKHFRKNEIDGIKENIRNIGLLQPILVCNYENTLYLTAGQKRLLSFIELNKEEIELNKEPFEMKYLKIQSTIKNIDDLLDLAKLSIAENEARENPFVIDTANSLLFYYNELKKKEGNSKLSKNDFAEIAKNEFNIQSSSTLTKYLKIATLEQEIQDVVFEKEFNNMTFLYYLAKTHMSVEEKLKELKLNMSNEKKSVDFVEEKKNKKEVEKIEVEKKSDFLEKTKTPLKPNMTETKLNDFEDNSDYPPDFKEENEDDKTEAFETETKVEGKLDIHEKTEVDNSVKFNKEYDGKEIDVNVVTEMLLNKNIKGAIKYLENFI